MNRTLERELMDDAQQSVAYARADFSTSNQFFVDRFLRQAAPDVRTAVDIGCGPGDVVVRLARAAPTCHLTAIDGSAPMLALARAAVRDSELEHRISLVQGYVPGLPVRDHVFDAVLSKDLLHHLPNPLALWTEALRLGRPHAAVAVMDLIRPATQDDARRIVQDVAADADPILQEDFFNSLCAAFTLDEVRDQLATAGLDFEIEKVSNRHMLITGVVGARKPRA